ncbi:MAG: NAD(P)-dependent oxidoreductase [Bacteroidota bacterium]
MNERVLLTGASGSMGFEAFKLLWERRERYEIVLLLRPSKKNRRLFRPYERDGAGLKIVWGDALNREDVEEACRGIDWCLHTMALIPPAADRDPEMVYRVNLQGTRHIVEAIEAENPEHTRMVHIGSVAQYGDRLPPVHVGRTGDPILPSVGDHYALSKISAELVVMQSRIRHRVSLRQTFIMIPGIFSLMDPIMFHQPLHTCMENITVRDAGRLLVSCLEVPGDSGFWGGYFNISGGAQCRTTYIGFLERIYRMLGLDARKVMKRHWFALKNFHQQFYDDATQLNKYLQHWGGGESQEDFYREVWSTFPWYLQLTAWCNRYVPPFRWLVGVITYSQLKKLALKPRGALRWIREDDRGRIDAFFGSKEAWENIPDWDAPFPPLDHDQPYTRLDHGYDESKRKLEMADLQKAAGFRGGSLLNGSPDGAGTPGDASWSGEIDMKLTWSCCQGHTFEMTPHAVLKGGHWCPECIAPPWSYDAVATKSGFAAQVLKPSALS